MPKTARALPPLDLLVGFEAAARHLSFTRAAAELFLTQSAVSRQILTLEEFLGLELFERRHKALALTEAGQAYFRTVGPILHQLRESTRRLRESRTGHLLTVTTTISFASMWLVPRLALFRKEHPNVDVRVAASTDVVDIDREGIDLAIRDSRLDAVPPGSVVLMGDHVAPVCSPGLLKESKAAKRGLGKPEDLRHHVLLHMHDPQGRFPFISWASWLETHGAPGLTPAGSLVFGQYDQVIAAALHGQGVALGRMSLLQQDLRDKRLVTPFGKSQRIARAFHVLYARDAESRPEARQFVEWIQKELKRES
jgi:LysR family glycine cleavage system transcriptional activator